MTLNQAQEQGLLFTLVNNALRAASEAHDQLGRAGIERMPKAANQFGDAPLVIDFEAEEAVLASMNEFCAAYAVSIRIFSEEHGIVEIGVSPYDYTVFLDGIDGSYICLHEYGTGRYATMLGMFKGEDPAYGDALVSGIEEHATGRFFGAAKGAGAFVFQGGLPIRLTGSGSVHLTPQTRIYTDMYMPLERQTYHKEFEGRFPHLVNDTHCSAINYTDLLLGAGDVVVESMAKKQDLEKLVAYLLIIEAGGYVLDSQGNSLEDQKCLSPGAEERLMIAAATASLAREVKDYLAA
ncbi:MAG: hypothetical protein HY006_02950 [Candidatus Sungbacteria bacterium]|nr:hypothetical protein [Candidatus Sungbacteria bacterium]